MDRDGEWSRGNAARTFASISPLRQAFSWVLCLLKGPGTLWILSSQEIWVLFDLAFSLPSFTPAFASPKPGVETVLGRILLMLVERQVL